MNDSGLYITHNQVVPGSSPGGPTTIKPLNSSELRGFFMPFFNIISYINLKYYF
ncbi:MAG: hypothetical protein RLZZ175_884 [Bacteroidota bacterium]|jgi:hypothetical protein